MDELYDTTIITLEVKYSVNITKPRKKICFGVYNSMCSTAFSMLMV